MNREAPKPAAGSGGDRLLMPLGFAGLAASIGVGIGEFLVHFTGGAPHPATPFGFLLVVPTDRMTAGHFLMIGFLPLYFLGYGHIYLALRPAGRRLAGVTLTLAIFALAIGGVWVGSRAFLGHLVHLFDDPALRERWPEVERAYGLLLESLLAALRALMLGVSALFVWGVLSGRSLYPRWMALLSPAPTVALIFLAMSVAPRVGSLLVPAAMNVAHAALFAASLVSLRGQVKRPASGVKIP